MQEEYELYEELNQRQYDDSVQYKRVAKPMLADEEKGGTSEQY
jgi:hypothetical protein